ncbi:MAG: ASKHA domain-containing protein [Thermodesulfobacteriota bacterium]
MVEETNNFTVAFLPSGRRLEIEEGESIIYAARQAGIHINASCGGSGVCGKCRVIIEEGEVSGGLSERLSEDEIGRGVRQACTALISGEVSIRVPEESTVREGGLTSEVPVRNQAAIHYYDIDDLRDAGLYWPPVEKFYLELPSPDAADNMSDGARIVRYLREKHGVHRVVINLPVMRKIRRVLRDGDFKVTVTIAKTIREGGKNFVLNIQAGNWLERNFALAVDLGTTTIYGVLLDLYTGRVLAKAAEYNEQISYGEDVISRIIQAEKPRGLELMQELAASSINKVIEKLLRQSGVDLDELTSLTLAGNTTMSHLLLALEPHNIRRTPYVPVNTFFPPIRATDLGLKMPDHSVVMLYPAISSYVGGDIVAGVMGSGMYRTDKLSLFIDIGTNGEIVIGNREWLVCSACSAGPAFEGGGITHGMRAAAGAIRDFSIHPLTYEPMIITIANRPPLGICGSGLLIIIAALFELGVIDHRGYFQRELESPRIRQGRDGYEYVLVWGSESGTGSDIFLTEVDIENFLRAKAAIFAGVKTLLEEVGLTVADLEQVILAGTFGSFLDLDSAVTVGLLPEVEPEKVLYVGNGSLMGCWMSGVSNHIRRHVVEVVRRITNFELSEVIGFKDQYVASMFLPHTDLALFPYVGERLKSARSGTVRVRKEES